MTASETFAAEAMSLMIGKRVRQRRRELCASQRQLAQMAGISCQQLQRLECGATRISAATVWRLATALGVGVPYLYG